MEFLFVIIALLVVANFYFLFKRGSKGRNVRKKAAEERIATVKNHEDLVRKLGHEQEEAARRVELRNKTLEMYEQVRRLAEEDERTQNQEETSEPDAALDCDGVVSMEQETEA